MLMIALIALLGPQQVLGQACPYFLQELPSHCVEGEECRFGPVYCNGEFYRHSTIATCFRDGHANRWSIKQALIKCPNQVTPQLGIRAARVARHSSPSWFSIGNEDEWSTENRNTEESTSEDERFETDDSSWKFGSNKDWGLSDASNSEFGSSSDFFSVGPDHFRFDFDEKYGTDNGLTEENLSESEWWLASDPFSFNFGSQKEGSRLNTADSENGSKSHFFDMNDDGTSFGSFRDWGVTASHDASNTNEHTWGTGVIDGGVTSGGSAKEFSNEKFDGSANQSASEFFDQDHWNTRFGSEDKSSNNEASSFHNGNEEFSFGPEGSSSWSKSSIQKSSTSSENKSSSSTTTIQHGRRLAAAELDHEGEPDHLLAPML